MVMIVLVVVAVGRRLNGKWLLFVSNNDWAMVYILVDVVRYAGTIAASMVISVCNVMAIPLSVWYESISVPIGALGLFFAVIIVVRYMVRTSYSQHIKWSNLQQWLKKGQHSIDSWNSGDRSCSSLSTSEYTVRTKAQASSIASSSALYLQYAASNRESKSEREKGGGEVNRKKWCTHIVNVCNECV